jgi:hypothetical protein
MTSAEILQHAQRIVSGLIDARTPPIFETCRKAYADLGELVAASKRMDTVTPELAAGLDAVLGRLDVFRAGQRLGKSEEKAMTPDEYATYLQEQVEKALAEPGAVGMRRLRALQDGIKKALGDLYEGRGDNPSINMTVYVDYFQQASVEREGTGAPKVTSGTAQAGEVKATPGISIESVKAPSAGPTNGLGAAGVMKAVTEKVEAAEKEAMELDTGWVSDLASTRFLRGDSTYDFGRDGTK